MGSAPLEVCRKGLHPLTEDNVVVSSSGRSCRQCRRASQRTWVADKRAEAKIAPARPASRPASHPAAEVVGEDMVALVDRLEPVAWELVAAVHGRDREAVGRLLADRADVLAIILASQLPHEPRTTRSGEVVECGTNRGYAEHIIRGEPSCAACRAEHARVNAGYRARAREERLASARKGTLDAIDRRAARAAGTGVGPWRRAGDAVSA